ncbi:MAG: ArsR/SmtB family transcription factor [Bacillota bacterium]
MDLIERVRILEEQVTLLRTSMSALLRCHEDRAGSLSIPTVSTSQEPNNQVNLIIAIAEMLERFLVIHKGEVRERPAAFVVQARFAPLDKRLQVVELAELRGETDPAALARLAAVLANESRVQIIQALVTDERLASELTVATGLEGGPLYHHLNDLQQAGLVRQKGRGRYALTDIGQDVFYQMAALYRRSLPEEEGGDSADRTAVQP